MDLKEQIKMILDEIRPQFGTLGEYGFGGIGTPELEAAYSIAKVQGFLPPPLMQRVFEFTMHMNAFFMAALRD